MTLRKQPTPQPPPYREGEKNQRTSFAHDRAPASCSPSLQGGGWGVGRSASAGFTILELLLAILIAALLLAALYAMMNVTMQQTQSSRNAVEAEDLSRGIFNKMSIDLSGTLSPLPPKSGGNSAGSGGTSVGTDTTTTTTDPTSTTTPAAGTSTTPATTAAGSTTTTTAAGTTDDTTAGVTDNATAVAADYSFQAGIIGVPDQKKLVIYAGRVPEAVGRYGESGEQVRSDQRQIVYQLVDGRGLYRQERPWVTADGVRDSHDLDLDSPDAVLLAEEATDFVVEYTDGSSWLTEWDGTTTTGGDGASRLGPPRAIRVTIVLKIPTGKSEFTEKSVTQVIAVRSAPGTYTPPLVEATTDGSTTAGTTTDTTGSGGTTATTPAAGSGSSATTPAASSGAAAGSSGAGKTGGTGAATGGTGGSGGSTGGSGGTGGGTGNTGGGSSGKTGGTSGSSGSKGGGR